MLPRVMIGCPVRNRAWILPDYLNHLLRLDYPVERLQYCFIVNDCTDDTETILKSFADHRPVRLVYDNSSRPGGWRRGSYRFVRLAHLRNRLLEAFLESPCEYLFSVDSDILVPRSSLRQLVSDQVDVVSALVCNGEEIGDRRFFNIFTDQRGRVLPIRDFPANRLFQVDCTGAACLISRRVVSSGARYVGHWESEDIGFCRQVKRLGFSIFCNSGIPCRHIMQEGLYTGPESSLNPG